MPPRTLSPNGRQIMYIRVFVTHWLNCNTRCTGLTFRLLPEIAADRQPFPPANEMRPLYAVKRLAKLFREEKFIIFVEVLCGWLDPKRGRSPLGLTAAFCRSVAVVKITPPPDRSF